MKDNFYYTPKKNSNIGKCVDITEYNELLQQIEADKMITKEEKSLLKLLATRFIIFKYEKLADYYATTHAGMQEWLEKMRCVIVDYNAAINNGYFKYNKDYSLLVRSLVNDTDEI